jgi:hypothetical protein
METTTTFNWTEIGVDLVVKMLNEHSVLVYPVTSPTNQEMVFPWEKGLLSGVKPTSLYGSLINKAQFNILAMQIIRDIEQGDDVEAVFKSIQSALETLTNY